jgi:hypothetical protein
MKKNLFSIVVICLLFASCKKDDMPPVDGQMTLTTSETFIEFLIAGTGETTIDYGDTIVTYVINDSAWTYCGRSYYDRKSRTITITGKNVTNLNCSHNLLTSLDVSRNIALTHLGCVLNQLTSLNVSKNTKLILLDCGNNKLTSLDISKNTALESLNFTANQLTNLDVSKNTALRNLSFASNQLTNLDVSRNTFLSFLSCAGNLFTAISLNTLFEKLHDNHIDGGKSISIHFNPGTNNCDRSIATNKGWEVLR